MTTAEALGFSREVRGVPGPPVELEPSSAAARSEYVDRVRYLEQEMRLSGGTPVLHERLEQYRAAARELHVSATPTVFFGEQQRIDGALSLEVFKKVARAGAAAQQGQAT